MPVGHDNLNCDGDSHNEDGNDDENNELVSKGAFFQTACVLDEPLTYHFSLPLARLGCGLDERIFLTVT